VTRVARWLLDVAFASPLSPVWPGSVSCSRSSLRDGSASYFCQYVIFARIGFVQCALTEIGDHTQTRDCAYPTSGRVCGQALRLAAHSSEIRTGCANEPPSGSVRGHQATGVPTAIDSYPSETPPNP